MATPAPSLPGTSLAPTPLTAPTGTFTFPWDYHFPPFFTRQPIANTLHAQLTKWSLLLLSYTRSKHIFRLSLIDALQSEPFSNPKLNKKIDLAFAREIIDFMRGQGRADWITSAGSRGGYGFDGGVVGTGKVGENEKNVAWIYWRNVEEWANAISDWVDRTGQKNTVLTLYEITESDATRGEEFHGMDEELLKRALGWLVKKGRAQVFAGQGGGDEGLGVKFF